MNIKIRLVQCCSTTLLLAAQHTFAQSTENENSVPSIADQVCSNATGNPDLSEVTPRLIRGGFRGAEGIVWVAQKQKLYFSEIDRDRPEDIPNQDPRSAAILILDPVTAEVETFVAESGTNGLALTPDMQSFYAGAQDQREIATFNIATAERSSFSTEIIDGSPFNSPNDLIVRSDGNVYFTDSNFQLDGADFIEPPARTTPAIWVTPEGKALPFDRDLMQPNGISISPDENTLYVTTLDVSLGESGFLSPGTLNAYDINADGSISNKRALAATPTNPDGMTVDCAGNIYMTGLGGVKVVNPQGEELGFIAIRTEQWQSSNVTFGGSDNQTLFITVEAFAVPADERDFFVYAVDLNIAGLPF